MATYVESYDYHYPQGSYATPQAPPAERHVLAERYRTKMCRNYLTTGECPYEVRCMFAHGEHELRTTEMNVRDGLITEEAIKSFQRALNYRHGYLPKYVGAPPRNATSDYYVHNPYGYPVTTPRPHTPEEYPRESVALKVDPSAAIEP